MLLLAASFQTQAAPDAEVWSDWESYEPSSTLEVDHSKWQTWLDTYLVTQPDGATAVRYRQVSAAHRVQLDDYIASLSAQDPLRLNRPEQFAYWVNLYNALTVRVVLDHPKDDSIKAMGGGWFNLGPWDEKLTQINNLPITLNDIEHRILRPIWQDHRIHYVVNCASISCPNLSAQVFTAANIKAQLAVAETQFLGQAKAVHIDSGGRLLLSKIFQWYQEDFGETEADLATYLANALSRLPVAHISAQQLQRAFSNRRYAYNWDLNIAN